MSNPDFHTAYLPTSSKKRAHKLITVKRIFIIGILIVAAYFIFL